jgi:hypothetical protein
MAYCDAVDEEVREKFAAAIDAKQAAAARLADRKKARTEAQEAMKTKRDERKKEMLKRGITAEVPDGKGGTKTVTKRRRKGAFSAEDELNMQLLDEKIVDSFIIFGLPLRFVASQDFKDILTLARKTREGVYRPMVGYESAGAGPRSGGGGGGAGGRSEGGVRAE